MPRDNLYLVEIAEAIDRICHRLSGIDADGWDNDDMLRAAVLQQLTTIGEASRSVLISSMTRACCSPLVALCPASRVMGRQVANSPRVANPAVSGLSRLQSDSRPRVGAAVRELDATDVCRRTGNVGHRVHGRRPGQADQGARRVWMGPSRVSWLRWQGRHSRVNCARYESAPAH